MQKYNCLIVEDEPLAAEVLETYISQVHFLQLIDTCSDAIFAAEVLKKEKIDLIFLDIHLPGLKGLDFIQTLSIRPQIIITTAYQEYALKSYELNVLDYLLKPVEFSRFLTAVNKIHPKHGQPSLTFGISERAHLFFNVGKKKIKIFIDEILYIESLQEYIRIFTKNSSLLVKQQLGHVEELLGKYNFLRIHRSYIVAKDKIDAFTVTDVEIAGKQIPIGRSYKEQVMGALE